jgi:acyl-CoA thioesterase FadM
MKHDPWRQDPAQYTARYTLEPRYTDVDTLRHLNNSALHGLHQEARMRFLGERIGHDFWRGRGTRLQPARSSTDFLAESHYPQPLQAAVRVTSLDPRQITLATALFQNGRCTGLQSTQLVALLKGQPCAVPPEWQQALDAPVPAPTADAPTGEPMLPQRAQFPVQRHTDSRYGDMEASGRTSELALMRYAEQARSGLLRTVFEALAMDEVHGQVGTLVARVDLHVHRHVPPPLRWQLGAGITHIGRTSVVLRCAYFDDEDRCLAHADCVQVFVRRDIGGTVPLPDAVRTLLEQQRVRHA